MSARKNGIGRKLAAAVLGLVAGTTGGCMSVLGTAEDAVPYAGTQLYAHGVSRELEDHHGMSGSAIMLLDLPATMALDTVLLPITIPTGLAHGHFDLHQISLVYHGC